MQQDDQDDADGATRTSRSSADTVDTGSPLRSCNGQVLTASTLRYRRIQSSVTAGSPAGVHPETVGPEERAVASPEKRGWRWFVGIHADDPHFEEAVRLWREWRCADSPMDEDEGV